MKKFNGDIADFTLAEVLKSQKQMAESLYMQPSLFSDGAVKVPSKLYNMLAMHPMNKKRRPDGLLKVQMAAHYHLSMGDPYGILCRRFEGWYIKAIMHYLKKCGYNAYYEKIHEKGLGFTGYIIKLKGS